MIFLGLKSGSKAQKGPCGKEFSTIVLGFLCKCFIVGIKNIFLVSLHNVLKRIQAGFTFEEIVVSQLRKLYGGLDERMTLRDPNHYDSSGVLRMDMD